MKKLVILLIFIIFCGHYAFSQNNTLLKTGNPELKGFKTKNFFQLTLQGGFMNPLSSYFVDNYFTCSSFGFDLSYRVNTEVALYTEIKYDLLSPKDTLAPSPGYFESTVGIRFYFRPKCYRSSFFMEAGIGPYIFMQSSGSTPTANYASQTSFKFGGNAGIGGELVLTNSLFITLKGKINSVFEPKGTTTFVSGIGGFTIRF
ncbi:MAG: hypothetical protein WCK13_03975 [Ignavibacteriota bacterium]|nr:acyloxyacyl hydrolase [Ignavibacteriota bacterium]